ncbi:MAG: hypothetical protein AAGD38_12200 [Acidobacteriota bacterium]
MADPWLVMWVRMGGSGYQIRENALRHEVDDREPGLSTHVGIWIERGLEGASLC